MLGNSILADRRFRVGLLLLLYTAELAASLWIAYELRFDFEVSDEARRERWVVMLWLVPLQLTLLGLFHQLNPLLGYFSTPDLSRMFQALALSALGAGGVWLFGEPGTAPPRGVIVADFVLSLVGLTGVRLALRTFRETATESASRSSSQASHRVGVGIIGAGDAGAVLAHELMLKPGYGLDPIAFFDDDARKWNSRVHGVPVVGPPEHLLHSAPKLRIREAIIAMPSAPARRIGEIVRHLQQGGIHCRTVPGLDQLAHGQVKVSQLRNVEVQDLLGRERVELETEDIRGALQGRTVLVTGAGGSIGSELCRQIASYAPRKLILLDRSEPQLFLIEQELIRLGHGDRIVPVVADIVDQARIRQVFAHHRPHVVFHAAAHKHVPMMEHQPGEAVRNNALGTLHLAEIALEFEALRFTLISTDKAINPTSMMGASKRLAEMGILALHAANPGKTKFMAVRFGNVLGSSGSVIPIFQRQIAEGGPVRVTHPDMTRYFMTIPEASMLVLQSAIQGQGGEIFVLDMGKPVKIVDLARQMIELSGLKPDEDIQIEFIGLRPGEKLFEEISHKLENMVPTPHKKILRFVAPPVNLEQVRAIFDGMEPHLCDTDPATMKRLLKQAVPEYQPFTATATATSVPAQNVSSGPLTAKGSPRSTPDLTSPAPANP